MNRQPVLLGERLELRPLRADDWAALYGVAADRELWALHPANDRWQEPVFRAFFDDALAGGGAVAVVLRTSGAIVGSSRWQRHVADGGGSVEIGWTFLARACWGTGLNFEMKRLMLGHAFRWVEVVRFRVGEGNARSRRACEKIGARLTEESELVRTASGPAVHLVYAITRAEFDAQVSGGPLAG
jgi:RimJ/RimL family protein N-acetyltransferase